MSVNVDVYASKVNATFVFFLMQALLLDYFLCLGPNFGPNLVPVLYQ